ncbi:hypothetical protein BDV40DRAFT_75088 [Aspergillus tamarii]|uniref:F-box domain-containing protein n=1 Tax=Aspergillus tamarii TaxID=41984 RepID=A0A5N6UD95_ASPTM|nr:hypothetical protein BDV40DRAFT_75088 [Aspergillus tamarii]
MLLQLPQELVLEVAGCLEHGDASRLARVNRFTYQIVQPEVNKGSTLLSWIHHSSSSCREGT